MRAAVWYVYVECTNATRACNPKADAEDEVNVCQHDGALL